MFQEKCHKGHLRAGRWGGPISIHVVAGDVNISSAIRRKTGKKNLSRGGVIRKEHEGECAVEQTRKLDFRKREEETVSLCNPSRSEEWDANSGELGRWFT